MMRAKNSKELVKESSKVIQKLNIQVTINFLCIKPIKQIMDSNFVTNKSHLKLLEHVKICHFRSTKFV